MLQMPDAAMLETMTWWGLAGAAIALGGWAVAWLADRRSPFAGPRQSPTVEVLGFTPPGENEHDWTSPRSAARLAVAGAFGGALLSWIIAAPDELDDRLQLGMELAVVAAAALVLLRTMRDIPAVGEAPPDDPDATLAVRVRNAALKLAASAFMLAMLWFSLD